MIYEANAKPSTAQTAEYADLALTTSLQRIAPPPIRRVTIGGTALRCHSALRQHQAP